MSFLSSGIVSDLLSKYGYFAVGVIVALESMGIPLPGETTLIIAAIYAGSTHQLNIWLVIAAAAAGAIIGDNIGYWLGREFGYRLLLRCGRYVGLTERRIKLGQYLFMRYGGRVVFFGRFVAVLRALAAFLAGANHMEWGRFLLANAAGGIIWTTSYGLGAYYLGKKIEDFSGPVGIALGVVAAAALIAWIIFIRRHETELEEEAERALPGPLRPVHKRKVR
jgi:membrane protein DedA with SNARE-associated domain